MGMVPPPVLDKHLSLKKHREDFPSQKLSIDLPFFYALSSLARKQGGSQGNP